MNTNQEIKFSSIRQAKVFFDGQLKSFHATSKETIEFLNKGVQILEEEDWNGDKLKKVNKLLKTWLQQDLPKLRLLIEESCIVLQNVLSLDRKRIIKKGGYYFDYHLTKDIVVINNKWKWLLPINTLEEEKMKMLIMIEQQLCINLEKIKLDPEIILNNFVIR